MDFHLAGEKLRLLELRYASLLYAVLFFSRWLNSVRFVRRWTLLLTYNDHNSS